MLCFGSRGVVKRRTVTTPFSGGKRPEKSLGKTNKTSIKRSRARSQLLLLAVGSEYRQRGAARVNSSVVDR